MSFGILEISFSFAVSLVQIHVKILAVYEVDSSNNLGASPTFSWSINNDVVISTYIAQIEK